MIRGDIGLLARMIGVCRSTIYNRAWTRGIDLSPQRPICDRTIGATMADRHEKWLKDTAEKLK